MYRYVCVCVSVSCAGACHGNAIFCTNSYIDRYMYICVYTYVSV